MSVYIPVGNSNYVTNSQLNTALQKYATNGYVNGIEGQVTNIISGVVVTSNEIELTKALTQVDGNLAIGMTGGTSTLSLNGIPVGGSIITLDGDSGSAVSSAGVLSLQAHSSAGTSVSFNGVGPSNNIQLSFTDTNSNTFLGNGAGPIIPPSGTNNTSVGVQSLRSLTTGVDNVVEGYRSGFALENGNYNILLGNFSGSSIVTGSGNVALGGGTLQNNDVAFNVAIGNNTGNSVAGNSNVLVGCSNSVALGNGTNNIVLGAFSGNGYTSTESNNIILNHNGVAGDQNVTRIGSGQSHCYISGIDGVNVGSVATIVTESSDQLGTAVISATAGSSVNFVPSANAITLKVTDSNNNTNIGSSSGNGLNGHGSTSVGINSLSSNNGNANSAFGSNSMTANTNGRFSTALGADTLGNGCGDNNIAIGNLSGYSYSNTNTEHDNILINHFGNAYDIGATRIGTNGAQTSCYIAGIDGVNVGSVRKVLTMASDQIGTANISGANGISIATSGNDITIQTNVPLFNNTLGTNNISGPLSSYSMTSGSSNDTLLGYNSGQNLSSGSNNTLLGRNSGLSYTTENNNITINNSGTATDSGVIRIGTNGTHTSAYISGIDGVNVGSVTKIVTEASDKLGTANLVAGSNVTIVPTANTITISASGGGGATNFLTSSGTAVQSSGNITITPSLRCGKTVTTSGSGSTVSLNLGDINSNICLGNGSAPSLTGSQNTALGISSLVSTTSGSNNIGIGHVAGAFLSGSSSNNIMIGSQGVPGDSGVTRIGSSGTQTKCYITGIDGVNVGSVATVVTENGDQLGSAVITAGSGITITPSVNTITISSSGTLLSSKVLFASLVTLTANANNNITSLSVTAGSWELYGNIYVEDIVMSDMQGCVGWINSVSVTQPDPSAVLVAPAVNATSYSMTNGYCSFTVPTLPITIGSTTTFYLGTYPFTSGGGSVYGCGQLFARKTG